MWQGFSGTCGLPPIEKSSGSNGKDGFPQLSALPLTQSKCNTLTWHSPSVPGKTRASWTHNPVLMEHCDRYLPMGQQEQKSSLLHRCPVLTNTSWGASLTNKASSKRNFLGISRWQQQSMEPTTGHTLVKLAQH